MSDNTIMDKGWFKDKDNAWYFLADCEENGGYGAMQTGWYSELSPNNTVSWYFLNRTSGKMTTGWEKWKVFEYCCSLVTNSSFAGNDTILGKSVQSKGFV